MWNNLLYSCWCYCLFFPSGNYGDPSRGVLQAASVEAGQNQTTSGTLLMAVAVGMRFKSKPKEKRSVPLVLMAASQLPGWRKNKTVDQNHWTTNQVHHQPEIHICFKTRHWHESQCVAGERLISFITSNSFWSMYCWTVTWYQVKKHSSHRRCWSSRPFKLVILNRWNTEWMYSI